jgi:hypothetical protein
MFSEALRHEDRICWHRHIEKNFKLSAWSNFFSIVRNIAIYLLLNHGILRYMYARDQTPADWSPCN